MAPSNTNHAFHNREIKVFGGDQLRPNLHIKDYCEAVELLIVAEKDKIENQIFNVGYQNMSINEIAQLVKKVVEKEYPNKEKIKVDKMEYIGLAFAIFIGILAWIYKCLTIKPHK